ncbi:hypothetical protein [Streptomyces sp. TLI_146]|uniref:hypothetical protein n=1 Tax=Streptomyces sp. TLI_146 TaxID=1938858 RepID=UPI000C6FF13A|nr:hypothetical protein [Streptomyces sp. TLI_146]PKV84219.1 hypothetical protein BX283_1730 [Streptomyces sp. TLI_146]
MIVRSLFICGLLPLYAVLLALSVRAARRRAAARTCMSTAPVAPVAPFLKHFLQQCAGFPILCLVLISLTVIFPGRLP